MFTAGLPIQMGNIRSLVKTQLSQEKKKTLQHVKLLLYNQRSVIIWLLHLPINKRIATRKAVCSHQHEWQIWHICLETNYAIVSLIHTHQYIYTNYLLSIFCKQMISLSKLLYNIIPFDIQTHSAQLSN